MAKNLKGTFEEIVDRFLIEDPRYPLKAYLFVRDGFEEITDEQEDDAESKNKQLSAKNLSIGLKNYALDKYGPMASFILREWGINATEDFGEIVYNLIDMGLFSQSKGDKKSDFLSLFDLQKELKRPFGNPNK